MKKEFEEIKSNLKKLYEDLLNTVDQYINSFSNSELLSFGISKEEAKEKIKQYERFISGMAVCMGNVDSQVARLTKLLYSFYDINDEEMVKNIGEIILKQDRYKAIISDFMESCEKGISRKEKKASPQALQRNAIALKQKISSL